MKHLSYFLLLSLLLVSCGKKAPTDEQLRTLCRNADYALTNKEDSAAQAEALYTQVQALEADCDIEKITPEQVELLFETGGVTWGEPLRNWISPLLKKKAEKDGTPYAYCYWRYYPGANGFIFSDGEIKAYQQLLTRPDIAQFVSENPKHVSDILGGAIGISADKWAQYELLEPVKKLLTYPMPEDVTEQTVKVFNNAFSSKLPDADKEEIRLQVLGLYENLVANASTESRKKRSAYQVSYLKSPFATGKLIGETAPELHFKWLSRGSEKTLSDFKGKVVMLDFWATKCAPCIASFPEVAKLQDYYANKPVAILGITSVQGYFIDTPNQRTVNTENDPQKEFDLTAPYMKSMGMNWRVAYTEEDVMNVDYGVLAIPHVTLIDKEGRVRYNNVVANNAEKIKLIDSLLNE